MKKAIRLIRYDLPLHFVLLVTNWLPDNVLFFRLRGWLASHFFGSCGNDLRLGRNISFYNPGRVHIGNNVYIAYGNWFSASITIEDEVMFGPYCIITSGNHTRMPDGSFRYGAHVTTPIRIGRGSWIGAGTSILRGGNVGNGSVVSAGSVVTSNIPSNVVCGGIPAKVLKLLDEEPL